MSTSHMGHGRKANAYVYLSPTADFWAPTLAEYGERARCLLKPDVSAKVFELMTGVDKEYFSLFWDPNTHQGIVLITCGVKR